ncbi:OTU7 [Symbiodinium pilosum]|uniref:OTU7 protein n=1 Tax=Symbiodinium pilosum TaxID=2952 RepID=A0A812W4N2_SYMPI|nr:OTU7 [Symbiodinium pilosum]
MSDGGYGGSAPSLDSLFKGKAKKKIKPMNFNPAFKAAGPMVPKGPADQDLLKSCGLWVKEVEGDGACLFRAFADQLVADETDAHAQMRERCVDFMEAHRDDFEPFIDEDFEGYCSRMREKCTWGGHVEAQALARLNGVNAVIYQPSQASGKPDQILRSAVEITASSEDARCVQLSFHPTHHAGQHYNSVRCCTDSGSGAAELVSFSEIKRRIEETLRPKESAVPDEAEDRGAPKGDDSA